MEKADPPHEEEIFLQHDWDTDVQYARFLVQAIRKGYFEIEESKSTDEESLQEEYQKRLSHLKIFYWSRVLGNPIPLASDISQLQLSKEASLISQLLRQNRSKGKPKDFSKINLLLNLTSPNGTRPSGSPEFKILLSSLELAVALDKFKQKYEYFLANQDTMSVQERDELVKEIGNLFLGIYNNSKSLGKTVLTTQLINFAERGVSWIKEKREGSSKQVLSDIASKVIGSWIPPLSRL